VLASALILSTPALAGATLLAGFGAGLFGHGTLTATMRSAPREQIGLSLGAWGAVQATAAGLAIAIGGVIRDVVLAAPSVGATSASPYIPVFALEAALLLLAVLVALPLRRGEYARDRGLAGPEDIAESGTELGLAAPRP
jgi:BCD family chlorophyll transporter-like MFS transporter